MIQSALQQHQHALSQHALADYAAKAALPIFDLAGLRIDFSKNYLNQETLSLWQKWWDACDIEAQLEALQRGEIVNLSEQRSAQHHLLRQTQPQRFGREIQAMRQAMQDLKRQWQAQGIRDVIHLGIGGSELGMRLLCEALRSRRHDDGMRVHFISSPDPERYQEVLQDLNPAKSACLLASKSFRTEEVLHGAQLVRDFLGGTERMVALTAAEDAARAWGITQVLPLWDWVGGRYSLASVLALPLILQNDYADYEALLRGMERIDQHCFDTPLARNVPVLMATLDAWYNHYFHYPARIIMSYSHALRTFPAYVQQLAMESLGKHCSQTGEALSHRSGMMIWGGRGTEAQHSFFQWLHQGSQIVPVDMIVLKRFDHVQRDTATEQLIHSHYLGQMSALMLGQPEAAMTQRSMGNRPSTAIVLERLTPETLGALCALYEHKTSVEALLYGINAYDQWGVEYGKAVAEQCRRALQSQNQALDPSTLALARYLKD